MHGKYNNNDSDSFSVAASLTEGSETLIFGHNPYQYSSTLEVYVIDHTAKPAKTNNGSPLGLTVGLESRPFDGGKTLATWVTEAIDTNLTPNGLNYYTNAIVDDKNLNQAIFQFYPVFGGECPDS